MNPVVKSGPSVGELLESLTRETGTLVRQELRLASMEVGQKARGAGASLGTMLVGGAIAHAGFMAILFGLVVALGGLVPVWVAALGVGAAVMTLGLTFASKAARGLRDLDLLPRRAIQSLNHDKAMIEEPIR